jgi:hypothetical protein
MNLSRLPGLGAISGFLSYMVLLFFFSSIGSPTILYGGWMVPIFSIGLGGFIGYLFSFGMETDKEPLSGASIFATMVIAFAISIVADFLLLFLVS